MRVLAAGLALALSVIVPAAATTLADLEAAGYRILRNTRVSGHFIGCVKNRVWTLADGSKFICHDFWRADSVDPAALLLEGADDDTYVLLIGGHAYDAGLTQLGDRVLGTPIALGTVDDAPPAPPVLETPDDLISPIDPVDSINGLRDQDHLLLNTAQGQRPASHGPQD